MKIQMNNLEKRLTEMETRMNRKIAFAAEENPKSIMEHIRMIEEKQATLWADNMERHAKNFETLENVKMNSSNNTSESGKVIFDLKKDLNLLQNENRNLRRDFANLSVSPSLTPETNSIRFPKQHHCY